MSESMFKLNCALKAERPVVFFLNGYGDNYINLPALRALSRLFAGRLTFVCRKSDDLFCFNDLSVKRRVELEVWRGDGGKQFDAHTIASNIGCCDLFMSLVPWHSDSLNRLLNLLRPPLSIGFFEAYHRRLELDYGKHSADLAFDVALTLEPNLRLEDFAVPLRYSQQQQEIVRQLLYPLKAGTKTLAVHADTLPYKMWVADRWVAVLDEFLEAHPEYVALLVGTTDQKLDVGRHADRVIPCYGLPLESSCCLVAASDLFLGVDSLMLHVADLARVPGVALFASTSAREFGFRFGPTVTIQADGSMSDIKVNQVVRALNQLALAPRQAVIWQAE